MSILDDLFEEMRKVYTEPSDIKKLEEELWYIDWEMTKLQSQKDLILDQLKKQTNAQIQDHPVATHSR